ncbi:MAG: hypothetical protein MK226_06945 [Saprospiraceae bacterium]|nr:hypothetical protein [Saprospiraceae bacterium]
MDKEKLIKQIIALKKADLVLRDQLIENKQLGKGYHPDMEKEGRLVINKIYTRSVNPELLVGGQLMKLSEIA